MISIIPRGRLHIFLSALTMSGCWVASVTRARALRHLSGTTNFPNFHTCTQRWRKAVIVAKDTHTLVVETTTRYVGHVEFCRVLISSKGNHWCSRSDNSTGSTGYHYSNKCDIVSLSLRWSVYLFQVMAATTTPIPMVRSTITVALGILSILLPAETRTNPLANKLGTIVQYVCACAICRWLTD